MMISLIKLSASLTFSPFLQVCKRMIEKEKKVLLEIKRDKEQKCEYKLKVVIPT